MEESKRKETATPFKFSRTQGCEPVERAMEPRVWITSETLVFHLEGGELIRKTNTLTSAKGVGAEFLAKSEL